MESKFWTDRGIDPEVRDARPYVFYEADDPTPVREAYKNLRSPGQKASITRKAKAVGGIIIMRHPVLDGDEVFPEIRPHKAISTATPRRHWHGFGDPPEDDRFYERMDPESKPGLAHRWKWHTEPYGETTKENRAAAERGEEPGNTELVHPTESPGKYHFAPNGKKDVTYPHNHAINYSGPSMARRSKYSTVLSNAERWERHVETAHGGVDVVGEHWHTVRRPDPSDNLAKRIDIHPWAEAMLDDAETVFYGLEGCLKADSILSAILREGLKASVISVPSVTLWDAPELEEFAKLKLRGKRVVIVPDSDWIHNSAVIEQARLCRTYLRRMGVGETYVAAPPLKDGEVEHKGVDDYLGEGGGTLGGLSVQHRTVDEWRIRGYLRGFYLRKDRHERDADMLIALAAHADQHGEFHGTLGRLSRVLGVGARKVERAAHDLEALKAIEISGSLAIRKLFFTRGYGWASGENPTLTVREDLRGSDSAFPLASVLCSTKVLN